MFVAFGVAVKLGVVLMVLYVVLAAAVIFCLGSVTVGVVLMAVYSFVSCALPPSPLFFLKWGVMCCVRGADVAGLVVLGALAVVGGFLYVRVLVVCLAAMLGRWVLCSGLFSLALFILVVAYIFSVLCTIY